MRNPPEDRPFVETVRDRVGELASQVTEAQKIRLLCPQRHFVFNLAVIKLSDGLVLTEVMDSLNHHDFALHFSKVVADSRLRAPRGSSEWIRQTGDRIGFYKRVKLDVECPHKKCAYTGSFDYYSFSAEVGATADRRHAEHQLTN